MKKLIKFFLCMVVVVLCILIVQNLQFTDTNTIDSLDYWMEEEIAIQYLYYMNNK
jgi:low affinity Fe/Cu permease